MSTIGRIAWERWKILGEAFGEFQARLLVVAFYFTIFAPFALGVRLLSDPLRIRKPHTSWPERISVSNTLGQARRQF